MFVQALKKVGVKRLALVAVALCVGILVADLQALAGRGRKKKSRLFRRPAAATREFQANEGRSLTTAQAYGVPDVPPQFVSGVSPEVATATCDWTTNVSTVQISAVGLPCGAGWTFQFTYQADCTGSGGVGCGGLYVRYLLYNFNTTTCIKGTLQDYDTCQFFYPSAKCGQDQSQYYYCFSPTASAGLIPKYFLLFVQLSPGDDCTTDPITEIGPIYVKLVQPLGGNPTWSIINSPC